MSSYNYIIVGAGSSGSVIASRLVQNADTSVLLVEAGPVDRYSNIHRPAGLFKLFDRDITWNYCTVAQRHCNNREMAFPQGRVLGGGSSVNGFVYTRGCPEDYDRWSATEGCNGWSFEEVLPYFVKSEDNNIFADRFHGSGGPQGVSSMRPDSLTTTFVKACQQAGIPFTPDFNGRSPLGAGVYQTTTRAMKRCSTATAYLRPVREHHNLTALTDCTVRRIIINQKRAVGIEYIRNGETIRANADTEVIVCAGAIGSPRLLLLSGLGPKRDLRTHELDVHVNLPGVGQNLQDHLDVDIVYSVDRSLGFDKYKSWHRMLMAGLQYELFRTGPVTSTIVEGGAFWALDNESSTPDFQFHFLPASGVEPGVPPVATGAGCTLNSYFVRPRSRGSVSLSSANPLDPPVVDPNYLADAHDLDMSVAGFNWMREIMQQGAFEAINGQEHFPGDRVQSQSECRAYVRNHGRTAYHPVGTCRMGTDDQSVVDPTLRVHEVDALRVCDASVMPSLVSSNTNAASIMIGEKASDLILADRS